MLKARRNTSTREGRPTGPCHSSKYTHLAALSHASQERVAAWGTGFGGKERGRERERRGAPAGSAELKGRRGGRPPRSLLSNERDTKAAFRVTHSEWKAVLKAENATWVLAGWDVTTQRDPQVELPWPTLGAFGTRQAGVVVRVPRKQEACFSRTEKPRPCE